MSLSVHTRDRHARLPERSIEVHPSGVMAMRTPSTDEASRLRGLFGVLQAARRTRSAG